MMKYIKEHKNLIISPLIVMIIVLINYLLKGIYPFGSNTISSGDIAQSYAPFYYYLYDVLHASKSMFFDFALGMGSNTFGRFVLDGYFNPVNWIIILNSRSNVLNMLSFILLIKLMFIAVTSNILFNKINKKNNVLNTIFAVLYAMSGYTLSNNFNIMWLDVVGLFPLLILSLKYMFEKDRIRYFSIVLALMLILNYNIAFMVILFVALIVPIYIYYMIENKKRAVINLFLGVGLASGLCAFAVLPALYQTVLSNRMSGVVQTSVSNINLPYKATILFFASIPVSLYILGLLDKNKKSNIFKVTNIALILTYLIPVLFEKVNLVWHTGSYQAFPMRYGFIPIMILFIGALSYFNTYKDSKKSLNKSILTIVIILTILLGSILVYNSTLINKSDPAFNYNNFITYSLIFISLLIGVVIDLLSFKYLNKKNRLIFISITSLLFVSTYTYGYVGILKENKTNPQYSDEPISYALRLKDKIDTDLYRVKDTTLSGYESSPYVSNLPSVTSFMHLVSKNEVETRKLLGYGACVTKMFDSGGTLLTDQILGIKYIVSYDKLSSRFYTYVDKIDDKYIYTYNKNISYGVLYDNVMEKIPSYISPLEVNNYLYKNIFNKDEDIIDIKEYKINLLAKSLEYDIDIVGGKELYLYVPYKDFSDENVRLNNITVNGSIKYMPYIMDKDSTVYPESYYNGILDLGYFKDTKVRVTIDVDSVGSFKDYFTILFGEFDISKYEDILDTNHNLDIKYDFNKITVKGSVDKDTNLLLPLNYQEGYVSDTKVNNSYNIFTSIPLKEGDNNISIKIIPKYLYAGIIISILAVIIFMLLPVFRNNLDLRNIKILLNLSWIVGIIIYLLFIIVMYIIPIIKTFID